MNFEERIEERMKERPHETQSRTIDTAAGPYIAIVECNCGWGWSKKVLGMSDPKISNMLQSAEELHKEDAQGDE